MGKVHINALYNLSESLGMEKTTEESIPDEGYGDDYCVKDLLNRLCARYHHFDQIVFDRQTQELTGEVMIFLNGRNVALSDGLETKLKEGDVLTMVYEIEGG